MSRHTVRLLALAVGASLTWFPVAVNAHTVAQVQREATSPPTDEPEERGTRPPVSPRTRAEERSAAADAARHALWQRLDTDHDGRISVTESGADADFDTGFRKMDTDRDGYVSDAEYRRAIQAETRQVPPPA